MNCPRPALRWHVAGLLLAATMVAACSTGAGGTDDLGAWGETRVVEDLRIGLSEGAREYLFGNIDAIVQHTDGTVFILDTQAPIIRRYDAHGVYMHDIGGAGQGPGEYSRVEGMTLLPDGNIAIWDTNNHRITIFAPDGALVEGFSDGESGHYSQDALHVDCDGNFYLYTVDREAAAPGQFPPRALVKLSPKGERLGKIPVPSDDPDTPGFVLMTREGRLENFTTRVAHTLLLSGHLAHGHTASYALEIEQPDGENPIEVTRPWEPVPLKPEEKGQWEAQIQYFVDYAHQTNQEPPDFAPIPATKPAFMDLHAGVDGTLWVRRYAEAHERDLPPRPPRPDGPTPPRLTWWQYPTLDAFDEEGTFLGTVELPSDTWVAALHSDWIWTVQPNEDAENVAVRYRIEKSR